MENISKELFPNTEICIDLKLFTRKPGRMDEDDYLDGMITRDGDSHYTFIQNAWEKKKANVVHRNPHVYEGTSINVNRTDNGTLYPTFNRPKDICFKQFCLMATEELLVVSGIEEEG